MTLFPGIGRRHEIKRDDEALTQQQLSHAF